MKKVRKIRTLPILWVALLGVLLFSCRETPKEWTSPNVLLISMDDLNDWVGALKGCPNVQTPNMDRLVKESVLFTHAYTPAPLCNPSRTAVLTGVQPYTSGIYGNKQVLRNSPILKEASTLPQYFRAHGYRSLGSGKVFHYAHDSPSWDVYWPSLKKTRPNDPEPQDKPLHGMPVYSRFFDWGPIDADISEMGDWKVADWVSKQLGEDHEKPFFLACGFYKPHLPWYIPKKYFERYPLDEIVLPVVDENDLSDVPLAGRDLAMLQVLKPKISKDSLPGDHMRVVQHNKWKEGVQAYLAAITFVDDCLGKVLDALENSKYYNNTVVVLWSDHGYHLGEKSHWRKSTLWEEGTHSVLMFKVPGVSQSETKVDWPVSLIDIYPSLVEICKLPKNDALEGRSLLPLLKEPDKQWDYPVISTFKYKNHSIRSKQWRYIRYADGSEELYDHRTDSLEWRNLAGNTDYKNIKSNLAQWLPEKNTLPINP